MMKYNIDKELKKLTKYKGSAVIHLYPLLNIAYQINNCKSDDRVTVSKYSTLGYNGGELSTLVIEPKQCADTLPCIVFYHGGGFLLKASTAHYQIAKWYAEKANCKVVFTDYRLLPKYRYPVAIEDCYNTYIWAVHNAERLNINSDKIIVAGDSAGGNIAANVAVMLWDRKQLSPKGTLLIYPVMDRSMNTESMRRYTDAPIWDAGCTELFWKIYLKDQDPRQIQYASPMEAGSLGHFPKTYVEVAEFDCLHDEGVAFAEKLQSEGIVVELHEVKGACHGFEAATESKIVADSVNRRIQWIRSVFD
ncbi:MAG: alpha/beta hydrolase [Eubacteriales bacterium]|nr:alpha/beta hydrolase [Eubacteriales bacterium]